MTILASLRVEECLAEIQTVSHRLFHPPEAVHGPPAGVTRITSMLLVRTISGPGSVDGFVGFGIRIILLVSHRKSIILFA